MPINHGFLNGEEYRAIRKVLGFSQDDATEFHGLKNRRTIHQWESGRSTTSSCACIKMLDHIKTANDFVERKIWEQKHYRPQPIIFLTYDDNDENLYMQVASDEFYFLSDYKMAIARAYVKCLEQGLDAHLVVFDPIKYDSFLEATNGVDTAKAREEWARQYYMRFVKA